MSDEHGWFTATDADSSPLERERDREIERRIIIDGRPLGTIVVLASLKGERWNIQIFGRVHFRGRPDGQAAARGRTAEGSAMSDDAPTTSPQGRVYFVQAGEHGPIKIGWTAGNPLARMATLQTGNHEPLRLLAWAPGSQQDERALHERFAPLRMIGEWFRPEAGLLAFVGGVAWASREQPAFRWHEEPFDERQLSYLRGMFLAASISLQAQVVFAVSGVRDLASVPAAPLPPVLAHLAQDFVRAIFWIDRSNPDVRAGVDDVPLINDLAEDEEVLRKMLLADEAATAVALDEVPF